MKAFAIVALTSLVALCARTPAWAGDHEAANAVWKLNRGIVNAATGLPAEMVSHTILSTSAGTTGGPFSTVAAAATGVVVGTGWGFLRMASGVVDIMTFPLPLHHNRPVVEPEFPF
jgi:putative exosortase-associated protein (TIGR04073 family)